MDTDFGVVHDVDDVGFFEGGGVVNKRPISQLREIAWVTRSSTKNGDPMWILDDNNGNQVFAFGNQMWTPLWVKSGYLGHFSGMENGDVMVWKSNPIIIRVDATKQYPDIVHIEHRGSSDPDKSDAPLLNHTHYPMAREMIDFFTNNDVAIFSIATNAISLPKAEIVQVSVRDLEHKFLDSLVSPRNPQRLLISDGSNETPSQINGILPVHLMGKDDFNDTFLGLYQVMAGKHWIVWSMYSVRILDSVTLENGYGIIPRRSVTDISTLFSAIYGGKWNPVTFQYEKINIEDAWASAFNPVPKNFTRNASETTRMVSDLIENTAKLIQIT